jgi:hypothetical protein
MVEFLPEGHIEQPYMEFVALWHSIKMK